ncbi:hypothetical protein AB0H49_34035 [Nocardia sp. NPDC050713]|uniref:hypothetical protein n=1 Tax=Nocardia sp. NPDC050713 TaxID=3154511 RepID=UPI003408FA47
MSQSEVDEIGRETSRAAKRAGAAVAAIVERVKKADPSVTRLPRRERKEAQMLVSRILREEREREQRELDQLRADLAAAIQAHHGAIWHGHQVRPAEPMQAWYSRQQQLSRARLSIERRIQTGAGLSDTERGSAITALYAAHYMPAYQPPEAFPQVRGIEALKARVQAGISRLRTGLAKPSERRRLAQWEQLHAERAEIGTTAQVSPKTAVLDAPPWGQGRYAVWIARQDIAQLADQQRLEVDRLPVAQRPAEMTVDHLGQARDWVRSKSELLGRDVVVRIYDRDAAIGEHLLNEIHGGPEQVDQLYRAWSAALQEREPVAAAQKLNGEDQLLDRIAAADSTAERSVEAARFRAVVGWTDRNGVTSSRSKSFDSEQAATAWMRSNPDRMLTFGTAAHVQTWDTRDDRAPIYSHSGEHRAVMASLAEREQALARQQDQEPEELRFHGQVSYLPEGADRVVYEFGAHTSETDTLAWVQQQVAQARPAPGTTVQASAYEESSEGRSDPLFWTAGPQEEVFDHVAQLRLDFASMAADREQNTDRGVSLEQVVSERDQLRAEVEALQNRHKAAIAHNADLTTQLRKASSERDQLAQAHREHQQAPVQEYRTQSVAAVLNGHGAQPSGREQVDPARRIAQLVQLAETLTEERDRFRGERDEAVQALAERTPAAERFGSPERQAAQARDKARAAREERTATAAVTEDPGPQLPPLEEELVPDIELVEEEG